MNKNLFLISLFKCSNNYRYCSGGIDKGGKEMSLTNVTRVDNGKVVGSLSNSLGDLSDVNLVSPANGQVIAYNSSTQRWENAEQSIWTTPVSCAIGDTTCTIQNANILTTSIIDYYTENASNKHINAEQVITAGQDVLTFDALEEATNFRLHIINL